MTERVDLAHRAIEEFCGWPNRIGIARGRGVRLEPLPCFLHCLVIRQNRSTIGDLFVVCKPDFGLMIFAVFAPELCRPIGMTLSLERSAVSKKPASHQP